MSAPTYILTLRCRDMIGIVAAVASALAGSEAFIVESSHFGDDGTGLFFMRTVFRASGPRFRSLEDFRLVLVPVVQRFEMQMTLHDAAERMKVMLAVSKHGHCLNHLLHRWHSGELPVEVVGATAHYVNADLDESPIIEQETMRVDHTLSGDAFVRLGKDVENVVLARAVQWHAEHRVMLNGHRTVVFR